MTTDKGLLHAVRHRNPKRGNPISFDHFLSVLRKAHAFKPGRFIWVSERTKRLIKREQAKLNNREGKPCI